MKRIIQILLILISCVSMAYGQEFLDFNSRYNRQKRVLVVPFDERIYFNDATAEIAKRDGLTHDEIMEYFRYQLNLQLVNSLIDSCEVVDLFKDNTREDEADISGLYTTMSYELRLAEFELDTENMGALARKRAEKLEEARRKQREEEMKNARPGIQNGELVGRKQQTDDMYLHIIIGQPEVLKEIASRRKVTTATPTSADSATCRGLCVCISAFTTAMGNLFRETMQVPRCHTTRTARNVL